MKKLSVEDLYMHKACKDCPFRKHSIICNLGENRAKQIVRDLSSEGFVCHNTTGVKGNKENRKQCAGSMIMSIKQQSPNVFVDLYRRMFQTEPKLLDMEDIVSNEQEFIKIQSK